MARKQASRKMLGGYYFEGIINPSEQERGEPFKGKGRLVVLVNPQDEKKLIYLTEKQIRFLLQEVERGAHRDVHDDRKLSELFETVKTGILVHPAVHKCPIKPQELYMLLDDMYGEHPQGIKPPG